MVVDDVADTVFVRVRRLEVLVLAASVLSGASIVSINEDTQSGVSKSLNDEVVFLDFAILVLVVSSSFAVAVISSELAMERDENKSDPFNSSSEGRVVVEVGAVVDLVLVLLAAVDEVVVLMVLSSPNKDFHKSPKEKSLFFVEVVAVEVLVDFKFKDLVLVVVALVAKSATVIVLVVVVVRRPWRPLGFRE